MISAQRQSHDSNESNLSHLSRVSDRQLTPYEASQVVRARRKTILIKAKIEKQEKLEKLSSAGDTSKSIKKLLKQRTDQNLLERPKSPIGGMFSPNSGSRQDSKERKENKVKNKSSRRNAYALSKGDSMATSIY